MTALNSCCCWKDLRLACVASGIFTLVISFMQILVQIAAFTGALDTNTDIFGADEPEYTIYILYIVLASMDGILALTSGILLAGADLGVRGVKMFIPWLVVMPIYMCYEAGVNIYFFYSAFNGKYNNRIVITGALGYLVVPLVYWCIKLMLNVFGYLSVVSRLQQLRDILKVPGESSTNRRLGIYHAYTNPGPIIDDHTYDATLKLGALGKSCEKCTYARCACGAVYPSSTPVYGYTAFNNHDPIRQTVYTANHNTDNQADAKRLPRYGVHEDGTSDRGSSHRAEPYQFVGRY